ncbi:Ribosomal RNA small subunit methyltransferase F [Stieleria maiorica]|uniref:Ribosomal RNA small subunit methyltransferase F n=1 Tax=Stieleria maiorica TaxID=2795974 RepID=A0A5B9M8E2_9BACT|nr:hypothetical protein [Stieleria maiorica]QEF97422.1 Ribosomal RNA small subunit methyltransferase F [Stieleria maiorica]
MSALEGTLDDSDGASEADADLRRSLAAALGTVAISAEEFAAFSAALLSRHRNALRYRSEIDRPDISLPVRPVDWYSLGYQCTDPDVRPSRTLDYAAGDYFIQDAGSMLALAACQADAVPERNRLICDLCAAPGGKSSALLESIGDGFLLANEPIKSRIAPLAYNLARTGIDRYAISSLDPEVLHTRLGGVFDLVLADVPCSGQALLGRGKQSLAAVSPAQIEHSALRARRILAAAIGLLRPGGRLVLSTCTFAEAENESQVRWLLDKDGMAPEPIDRLAEYASDDSGCSYRLWPHRHRCAGSFAASLRSDIGAAVAAEPASGKKRKRREKPERLPDELGDWFGTAPQRSQVAGAVIRCLPEDAPSWAESISVAGPELAYRTGQTWKPSHEASLRRSGALRGVQSIEVDDSTARQYLSGQPIACGQTGWCVVRHRGRPLGWVKASRGTGKNHLPVAARMDVGVG